MQSPKPVPKFMQSRDSTDVCSCTYLKQTCNIYLLKFKTRLDSGCDKPRATAFASTHHLITLSSSSAAAAAQPAVTSRAQESLVSLAASEQPPAAICEIIDRQTRKKPLKKPDIVLSEKEQQQQQRASCRSNTEANELLWHSWSWGVIIITGSMELTQIFFSYEESTPTHWIYAWIMSNWMCQFT